MTPIIEKYLAETTKKIRAKKDVKPFKNSTFIKGYTIYIEFNKISCNIKVKRLIDNVLITVSPMEIESVYYSHSEIINKLFGV